MSSALGILKWSPKEFWQATFYEYTAAMKGHLISSGADLSPPLSKEDVDAAFAEHENRVKASMRGD